MKLVPLLAALTLFFSPSLAHSHGGGLNAQGCHNQKGGSYHCHGSPAPARSSSPPAPARSSYQFTAPKAEKKQEDVYYKCPDAQGTIVIQTRPCDTAKKEAETR